MNIIKDCDPVYLNYKRHYKTIKRWSKSGIPQRQQLDPYVVIDEFMQELEHCRRRHYPVNPSKMIMDFIESII